MLLKTLGDLELEGSSFARPKPLLLLSYLALEGPQIRRYMAELLWRDASDPMKSLGMAISRLRKGAPSVIEADNKRVWTNLKTDIDALNEQLEHKQIKEALELYKGAFLESLNQKSSHEFEEWIYSKRESIAQKLQLALQEKAGLLAAENHFKDAAAIAAKAYQLPDTLVEVEQFEHYFCLLKAAEHPLTLTVLKEARDYGLDLTQDQEQARAFFLKHREKLRPATNLPVAQHFLVGRDEEVNQICNLFLDKHQLVSLVGPGGIGKTQLALTAAQSLFDQGVYPEGVYFCDFETATDATQAATLLARSLSLNLPEINWEAISETLSSKSMLLVLDNLEALVRSLTKDLVDLLDKCPNIHLLITSRETLKLAQEYLFFVKGLAVPTTTQNLTEFAAAQLFLHILEQSNYEFNIEQHASDIMEICQLTEGWPLGIELTAAWVRHMPFSSLIKTLKQDMGSLEKREQNTPDKHLSLKNVCERSWQLLTREEQTILRQLAIFEAGFHLDAALFIVQATPATLANLIDKSFLRINDGRYTFHPYIKQFARQKLELFPDELLEIQTKHFEYFMQLVESVVEQPEHPLDQHNHSASALVFETANLTKAISRAYDQGKEREAIHGLYLFSEAWWLAFGQSIFGYFEAAELHKLMTALRRTRSKQSKAYAHALTVAAKYYFDLGDADTATHSLEESVATFKQLNAPKEQIKTAADLGMILQNQGKLKEAMAVLKHNLELSTRHNDSYQTCYTLIGLGLCFKKANNYPEAQEKLERALGLSKVKQYHDHAALALIELAKLAAHSNNFSLAKSYVHQAEGIIKMLKHSYLEMNLTLILVWIAFTEQNWQLARSYLQIALEVCFKNYFKDSLYKYLTQVAYLAEKIQAYKEAAIIMHHCESRLKHHQSSFNLQLVFDTPTIQNSYQSIEHHLKETVWLDAKYQGQAMSTQEVYEFASQFLEKIASRSPSPES